MKKLLAIVVLCGLGLMASNAFSDSTAPTQSKTDACFLDVC